jgi:hypothetical protein
VEYNRGSVSVVVLEVDPTTIPGIPRIRHRRPLTLDLAVHSRSHY